MYVDADGKVLAAEALTSGKPGSVAVTTDLVRDFRFRAEIRARMKRLAAVGYYVLHNHPSGNPEASDGDIALTKAFATGISGFHGGVIIDHNAYTQIMAEVRPWGKRLTAQTVNFAPGEQAPYGPERLGPETGQRPKGLRAIPDVTGGAPYRHISRPEHVAELGRYIHDGKGVTLAYMSNGRVMAVQDVPSATWRSTNIAIKGGLDDYIRGRARAYGAKEVFAYTTERGLRGRWRLPDARRRPAGLRRARRIASRCWRTGRARTRAGPDADQRAGQVRARGEEARGFPAADP